jgi:uncharacterized protein (DUF58 family)
MDLKELLKGVRKIEIKSKGLSNHLFAGEYHTAFKGKGMSFSEVRDYAFGDDIKNIDWNVTARLNAPFVKVFEEERELTVVLMVDISASLFLGSVRRQKNQLITELCAVLSFSAIANNDKVGLLLFSDKVEKYIPPKKGKGHVLIIRELLNIESKGNATNLANSLEFLSNVVKKKSIVFILSDFLTSDFERQLTHSKRKHDLIGIQVYDPIDANLPDVGLIEILDVESGQKRWIDTSNNQTRNEYNKQFISNTNLFKKAFLKAGADTISISTKEDYIKPLVKFFKNRV